MVVVTNTDQKINQIFLNIRRAIDRAIRDPQNKLNKEVVIKKMIQGQYPHEIAVDNAPDSDLTNQVNNLSEDDKKNLAQAYQNRPAEEYLPDDIAQEVNNNKDLKNKINDAQLDKNNQGDTQNTTQDTMENEDSDDLQEEDKDESEEDNLEDLEDNKDDTGEEGEEGENSDVNQDNNAQGENSESSGDKDNATNEMQDESQQAQEQIENKLKEEVVEGATKKVAEEAVKNTIWQAIAGAIASMGGGWVVVIIIVIVLVVLLTMALFSFGRRGHVQATAHQNSADFAVVLSVSRIDELKRSLDVNIDKFILDIEEIKKIEGEKQNSNSEVLSLCDQIVQKAKSLKGLSAAGIEGGNPENKSEKEKLKIEIINLVKKMIPMIFTSVPCLHQPSSGWCGQTSTMMLICAHNPGCGINKNSNIADYARLGSTQMSSSLIGLVQRNLPGKKIIQVNKNMGISNPNYEPLFEQAKKGNPVVIGTMFPPDASYQHYVTVTGYAGERNGVRTYRVNNPYSGGCQTIELPETYFRNNPYPGQDYWYMYVE